MASNVEVVQAFLSRYDWTVPFVRSEWLSPDGLRVYLRARNWCVSPGDGIFTLVVSNVKSLQPRQGNYSQLLLDLQGMAQAVLIENADPSHAGLYQRRGFTPLTFDSYFVAFLKVDELLLEQLRAKRPAVFERGALLLQLLQP